MLCLFFAVLVLFCCLLGVVCVVSEFVIVCLLFCFFVCYVFGVCCVGLGFDVVMCLFC